MSPAQSRPAKRHRVIEPGCMHRNRILIPFHKENETIAYDRFLCPVKRIQVFTFLIPSRFCGIDIFRFVGIVRLLPGCETDQPPLLVTDRENNAVAHGVPLFRHQSGRNSYLKIQVRRSQPGVAASIRQQATKEPVVTLKRDLTGSPCSLRRKSFCLRLFRNRRAKRPEVCSRRQYFQRLRKRTFLHPHHQFDYIPIFSAGITSKSLFLRVDRQRRMMIFMERTKSREQLAATRQADIPSGHLFDTDRVFYMVYFLLIHFVARFK